jgi:hypothetical protein
MIGIERRQLEIDEPVGDEAEADDGECECDPHVGP